MVKIKQVYIELGLPELFNEYRKRNKKSVMDQIDQLLKSDDILHNACIAFFNQAYGGSSELK